MHGANGGGRPPPPPSLSWENPEGPRQKEKIKANKHPPHPRPSKPPGKSGPGGGRRCVGRAVCAAHAARPAGACLQGFSADGRLSGGGGELHSRRGSGGAGRGGARRAPRPCPLPPPRGGGG